MQYSFLLSSERSGSNLITKIIDAHPQICGPSPTHTFRLFSQNLYKYGDLESEVNWNCLIEDFLEYLGYQLGEWGTSVTIDDLLRNCDKSEGLQGILKFIYMEEAKYHNAEHIFIKENKMYQFLPYILLNFPDCKFIYLVRDPRDTALSFKQSINHSTGIIEATSIWAKDQEEFLKCYSFLQAKGKALLITYENLVSNTENMSKQICEFLGVDFDKQMLAYHENTLTKRNSERWSDWKNLKKPILKNNFNKFLDGLEKEEIIYIENECMKLMDFFGYEQQFADKPPLSKIELEKLKKSDYLNIQSKIKELTKEDANNIRVNRLVALNKVLNRSLY